MVNLARALRREIEHSGLTLTAAAKRAKISRQTLYHVLGGGTPMFETILKLERSFPALLRTTRRSA